jgi:hypothetical protein
MCNARVIDSGLLVEGRYLLNRTYLGNKKTSISLLFKILVTMISIGIFIGFLGAFFEEGNNTITKKTTNTLSIYQLGFLTSCIGASTFLLVIITKLSFQSSQISFNPDSIPLLIIRICLEVLQSYMTIQAIRNADRSTFGVIRIITIPLLVIADIILGYSFSFWAMTGVFIIISSFLFFNVYHKTLHMHGWKYVLITSINAVLTLSAYKYSIDVYKNSFEIDQGIVYLSLFIFWGITLIKKKESVFNKNSGYYILKVIPFVSFSTYLISASYLYINASVATAVKRASEMVWSILFGKFVFNEQNFSIKLIFCLFLLLGIALFTIH